MTIAFNEIPGTLRAPGSRTEFNNELAKKGANIKPYRALLIAPATGGSAEAGKAVPITRLEQAAGMFGAGSLMYWAAKGWFDNKGGDIETFALPLANTSGSAASGKIQIAGTVQDGGVVYLYVGGQAVKLAVKANDGAAAVATALAAAVNAAADLPVSAQADAGAVTLTAKNKGLPGNEIDLRLNYYPRDEQTPTGLTISITAMAGGAGTPDLAAALAGLGDKQFDVMVMPFTDAASLKAVEDELASRWGPMRAIGGLVFVAKADNYAGLTTLGNGRNSPFSVIGGLPGVPNLPVQLAAATAAQAAFAAQNDPARPFQTLELKGILPPADSAQLTLQERNLLLYNGISTYRTNAGGAVMIDMLISTYKVGKLGQADESYLLINTVWTLSYLRYDWDTYIQQKYPRHKLADDGNKFPSGQPIMTPSGMKAEMVARAQIWQALGLVENIDQFTADSYAERNIGNPTRLDTFMVPDLVNPWIITGNVIAFIV
ncbi:phage tail sheath subtilisin-like domain-containing protein [Eikenella corrodens]|uniref:phage tail sheath subtilisin-like domain-containing protein n=1 Tax=Eikenella corrodens TaxID=539 RepID=UPI0006674CCA|nr:phage tail sheath subtilisin-like domain-containing protein [Eikenella corrodens]